MPNSSRTTASNGHGEGTDNSALMRAAQRLFLAAARILVGRLPWPTALDLLKKAYLEQARRQLEKDPNQRRVTQSALGAITGIGPRQITALQQEPRVAAESINTDAFISTIEAWATDPDWADSSGKPAELPIYGSGGSFQTLVRRAAGTNVTPQTVLHRLKEHGNVEYGNDGKTVRLVNRYYVPVGQDEMKILDAGSLTFIKLAAAIDHNARASNKNQRLLQQDRWSYLVPESKADEVAGRLRRMLTKNIEDVESYLEDVERAYKNHKGPTVMIGSGWFVFSDTKDAARDFD